MRTASRQSQTTARYMTAKASLKAALLRRSRMPTIGADAGGDDADDEHLVGPVELSAL